MRLPVRSLWALILGTAAAGLAVTAAQGFELRSYTNGRQLYDVCAADRDSCYMYVYGVMDQLIINDATTKSCTFNPDGVAGDKAVNAVLSYIRSHQDRIDWSAAALVQNAVRSKFPCPKKSKDGSSSASPSSPPDAAPDEDSAPSGGLQLKPDGL